MKRICLIMGLAVIFLTSGCYTYSSGAGNSGKLPPGQVKKATGSKSAKPFAPGQQKKRR